MDTCPGPYLSMTNISPCGTHVKQQTMFPDVKFVPDGVLQIAWFRFVQCSGDTSGVTGRVCVNAAVAMQRLICA